MKILTSAIVLLITLFSSSFAQNTDPINIVKAHWLQGTWKGMFNGKPFYETWRVKPDKSLICYSIDITNGDTTVRKNSEIKVQNGKIVYGDPNVFPASRIMENEIVFEKKDNNGHSRIIWFLTKEQHWWVLLEFPKTTGYYDLVKVPGLDQAIEKKLPKS